MSAIDLAEYEGPRVPKPEEWESALEMCRAIFFPRAAHYLEGAATWPMALHPDFRCHTLAVFHRGEPVSMMGHLERDIAVLGHRLRLGYIGGVCTHPNHRGKGLASMVLAASLHRLRQHGVDFVYISGARSLYYRAGADHVGGFCQVTVSPGALSHPHGASLRRATKEDIPLLCRLNEHDAVRFVRPYSDYDLILTYGHCGGRPSEFYLVESQGVPLGYLFVSYLEREGRRWLHVREIRGERQAALDAIASLADSTNMEVVVDLPRGDLLGDLFATRGLQAKPGRTSGTMKVLDFCRTLRRLKPYFASHLDPDFVESLTFVDGGGRFLVNSREGALVMEGERAMLHTLLGSPRGEPIEGVRATGEATKLLQTCLPIPWPSIYMNVI